MTGSSKDLAGLRAVVTGSSSGIGRAIALAFAKAGADVVIHYQESKTEAESIANLAEKENVRAFVFQADFRSPEDCDTLVSRSWKTLGGVNIWVNNAGADVLTGPNALLPFDEKFQLLMEIDVKSTIRLSRSVGKLMKSNMKDGLILNMGWDQAETGMEGDAGELFSCVKGGIMAFSRSLALTLAPEVRVNCLAPGWIRTSWGEKASAEWQDRVLDETPLCRWGTPEDVAAAAHFLASPSAAYLTGQTIRINGGAIR